MLKPKIYKKHISEPWFSLIAVGSKTVEGRLYQDDWTQMKEGDYIDWYNLDLTPFIDREIRTIIVSKSIYPCFQSYLYNEGLEKTLPSISSIDDGLKIYHIYYTPQDEKKYGVIALKLKIVNK